MYMLKLTVVSLAAVALLAGIAQAAQAAEPEPTRHILIRAWRGDQLVTETQAPLYPGHPATIQSGRAGPAVPEGMAPPPIKLSALISIRLVGDVPETKAGNTD